MPSPFDDFVKASGRTVTRWVAIDKANGLHQILLSRHRIDTSTVDMWVAPQIRNEIWSAVWIDGCWCPACKASIRTPVETIRQNDLVATDITGRENYESSLNRRHFLAPV